MRFQLGAVSLLVGALLCVSAGCGGKGPSTYPVTGTVTFNGTPLDQGQIVLMSADGHSTPTGGAIVDGKFALQSTPGEKTVEITATREAGPVNPTMGQAAREQYIPQKYNVESTLKATVVPAGANAFDFPLIGTAESEADARRGGK